MKTWTSDLLAKVTARAARITVQDAECLFSPGSNAENFLIVLTGAVRLEQTSKTGRTIVLYRVLPGESCIMTTTCIMSQTQYTSFGYAEGQVKALTLGQNAFRSLMTEDPSFMAAVFSTFSERLVELTRVIDELLWFRVDQKLAHWLVAGCTRSNTIRTTHQSVAQELGTAREVVSRTLKDFERRGWITLSRGVITVQNLTGLKQYANSQPL